MSDQFGQRQLNTGNLEGSVDLPAPADNPSVSSDQLAEMAASAAGHQQAQAAINAGRHDTIGSAP